MTQPQPMSNTDRADRARRQQDINHIRTRTDGEHLRLAIVLALGTAVCREIEADTDWVIVQVRPRIGIEADESEGTIIHQAFEPGDITLARYTNGQVYVASIRMGIVMALDAGDAVHLHHRTCPCDNALKPAEPGEFRAFDPATVPGLAELRARVQAGKLKGDTEGDDPWAA